MASPDRNVRRALAGAAGLAAVGMASLGASVVVGNRDPKSISTTVVATTVDDAAEASSNSVGGLQTVPTSTVTPQTSLDEVTSTEPTLATSVAPVTVRTSSTNTLPASSSSSTPVRPTAVPSSTASPTPLGGSPVRRLHAGPIAVSNTGRLFTFATIGSSCLGSVTWTFKGPTEPERALTVACSEVNGQQQQTLQLGSNTVSVELSDFSGRSQTSSVTFDVE